MGKVAMTMNVNMPPRLGAMVKAKVASGRYTAASDMVRKAPRLMEGMINSRSSSWSSCARRSRMAWQAASRWPGTLRRSKLRVVHSCRHLPNPIRMIECVGHHSHTSSSV
ncbi:MAG: type II toxin-antitoxin system ParD family antitoxin [Synechococcaceae cyanobacterium]